MNSEKVISNIKKALKEHFDNNYAYDMLVDFELDVIEWYSLFEYIDKLQQENKQLKDNWNKLQHYILEKNNHGYEKVYIDDILNKMQELEQGSGGNE